MAGNMHIEQSHQIWSRFSPPVWDWMRMKGVRNKSNEQITREQLALAYGMVSVFFSFLLRKCAND